jgi:hypothetical protein
MTRRKSANHVLLTYYRYLFKKNCILQRKNISLYIKKLQFFNPYASMKAIQSKEAFSYKKRTSALQNMKFFKNFLFCGSFLPSRIPYP